MAGVVGAGLVCVFSVLGAGAWRDYQTFGDVPATTGLIGAVDGSAQRRQWVTILQAPWQCDQLLRGVEGGVAFLPAREENRLLVARFDHEVRCESEAGGALSGVVERMDSDLLERLRARGLDVPPGTEVRALDVCQSCGRDNARIGVVVSGVLVVLGLLLYPLRRAYLSLRARARSAIDEELQGSPAGASSLPSLRLWGVSMLVLGALSVTLLRDYVWVVIPLPWMGVFLLLHGVWLTLFPATYRAFRARLTRSRPSR